MLSSAAIRRRFLEFFRKRGHAILPSAPLVPENDPSVLFNTAGMQPLVPYLLGEPHPLGQRLADAQKCVRTTDIDEIGDNTHATFFEMLGNWSLGDPSAPDGVGRTGYFKEEAIRWSYEFLTSKEEGLGLDPRRLYVTVFEGDDHAPRDEESYAVWRGIFEAAGLEPERRIFFLPAEKNWWSPGDNGPSGPDTEMYYDVTGTLADGLTHEGFLAADERQEVVEIWNDVFMEYEKRGGQVVGKLKQKNVDTGAGLERVAMVIQGKDNIFETDLLSPLMEEIGRRSQTDDLRARRIVADHIRTGVFLIGDGVRPSNTDQGYVLRRLLRRAVRMADHLGLPADALETLVPTVVGIYQEAYPILAQVADGIRGEIAKEERKFRATLAKGLKKFETYVAAGLDGKAAFDLYQSYGFPLEMTLELSRERGMEVDRAQFEEEFRKHQDLSRTASAGKFKGGLADHGPKVTAFHTATHLMLAALRKELGDHVHQAGSNITEERTRFDFTHPEKVSRETLDRVEEYVNRAAAAAAAIRTIPMAKDKARSAGVEGSFWEKYPDQVTVYQVEGPDGTVYSRELCGGPHVANTAEIAAFGRFRIAKEEASSAGVRRVKGVFEAAE